MRIGHGYDAHRLVQGRPLILGGVTIPFDTGLQGHSDADVLAHAVCDALLGAAALGDIGVHFPDTNVTYRGISSLKLLTLVGEMISREGYRIANIDATIVAERPKLRDFIMSMRENLAAALGMDSSQVSVKATTTEGMGFTGTGQGIAAWASALILNRSKHDKNA